MTAKSQTQKISSAENVSAANFFDKLESEIRKISFDAIEEAAATDQTNNFPAKTFEKLAAANVLEAVIPKRHGGFGFGIEAGTTLELLLTLKYLGYENLVVGRVFEGHFNAWQLIAEYGSEEQAERFAEQARREKHLFGVWNTEAGDGVRIFPVDDDKFRLEGAKTFATGVDFVARPIVTGKIPDGGWQMFVAPLDEIQTVVDDSWWKPLGMRASRSFRVDFSGAEIASENLIGAPGDYYRQPFFNGGAIRFAAVQLGAAELLFDLTRDFLRELNRTDDPFQQMRLGEMAIAVESGNQWLRGAARFFDEYLYARKPEKLDAMLQYAGMMRTAIEQICQTVMLNCTRSIGSRGLLQPYHFERVIRDLTMYLRQAAPDATLTGIGNFALKSRKKSFELWDADDE